LGERVSPPSPRYLETDMSLSPPLNDSELAHRRQRAVKTAKVIAAVAVVIYLSFILMGVFGQ